MAGVPSILKALARSVWREQRSFESIAANNFFLFTALMLQQSGAFVLLLVGLLLIFPLSADPLRKIPPERLGLWPLTSGERLLLRIASLWLSPAVWITLGMMLWAGLPQLGLKFLALMAMAHLLSLFFTWLPKQAPHANLFRLVPAAPGKLGGLVRKNLREFLSVLDAYPAVLIAVSSRLYHHLVSPLEPEAWFALTLIVAVAFSTYAQCLFGLDSESGYTRYRLLPLRGWQILLAKDLAVMMVLVLCVLPLAPLAGIAAGLAALAVGHHPSIQRARTQHRWRFTAGAGIGFGILQVILMFGAAALLEKGSGWWMGPIVAAYAASLAIYGWGFEGNSTFA